MNGPSSHKALSAQVAVRGDMLVLSLPDAIYPVVWQFDLSRAQSSTVEALPVEGGFCLRLKTGEGDVHEIAVYESRHPATEVLMMIHRALVAQGQSTSIQQMQPNNNATPIPAHARGMGHAPLAAAVLVLFIVLATTLFSVFSGGMDSSRDIPVPSTQVGVPLSAEDVLKGRGL